MGSHQEERRKEGEARHPHPVVVAAEHLKAVVVAARRREGEERNPRLRPI